MRSCFSNLLPRSRLVTVIGNPFHLGPAIRSRYAGRVVRTISSSAALQRDLYAKYRYIPGSTSTSTQIQPTGSEAKTGRGDEPGSGTGTGTVVNARLVSGSGSSSSSPGFKTASTSPAGTSFQDVPPPDSTISKTGSRIAIPIPAMVQVPIDTERAIGGGEGDGTTLGKAKAKEKEQEKEILVQGIVVPPKPTPPHEEECCMSGCVNCVYNVYADELEEYTSALTSARAALVQAKVPEGDWPKRIQPQTPTRTRSGTRAGEKVAAAVELDNAKAELQAGMDPVMAAFLALEGKLKKKQGQQGEIHVVSVRVYDCPVEPEPVRQ